MQRIGTRYSGNCEVRDDEDTFPLVEDFLASLFDDREEADRTSIIRNLQIFFGYILSGQSSHHMFFYIVCVFFVISRNAKTLPSVITIRGKIN